MEKYVRKLARSYRWQFLYARAKELNNIKLFENDTDFTYLQYMFLRWLTVYHSLYTDLATGEDYISEEVIKDDLRTEAYLLLKSKENRDKKKGKNNDITDKKGLGSVVFTRKK